MEMCDGVEHMTGPRQREREKERETEIETEGKGKKEDEEGEICFQKEGKRESDV